MDTETLYERERNYTDHVIGQTTLPQLFEDSVQRYGSNTAQRYKGGIYDRSLCPTVIPEAPHDEYESLSYNKMGSIIRTLNLGFRSLGVEKGDRVGIFANTRMEWAHSDYALLGAGAIVTTVYTESSPEQAQYLLDNSGSKGVVVENQELLERILEVEDNLGDLEFIVTIDNVEDSLADRDNIISLGEVHRRGAEDY
ncbi:MAG: AMP-binding protein, partial [bacterium]